MAFNTLNTIQHYLQKAGNEHLLQKISGFTGCICENIHDLYIWWIAKIGDFYSSSAKHTDLFGTQSQYVNVGSADWALKSSMGLEFYFWEDLETSMNR